MKHKKDMKDCQRQCGKIWEMEDYPDNLKGGLRWGQEKKELTHHLQVKLFGI